MNLSMLSGISGIRSHQTMLDVIGNNVANVNTPGFKSSRAAFEDVLSRNLRSATSGGGGAGGTNPLQVGIGSGVGSISRDVAQGAFVPTGGAFDLAIDGEAFFVVEKSATETLYTRVGAFGLDAANNLVDKGTGFFVLDDSGGHIEITKDPHPVTGAAYIDCVVEQDGAIVKLYDDGSQLEHTGKIDLARFNNPAGLDGVGHNMFKVTLNSGVALDANDGSGGIVKSGVLESSNVDLANELTQMIIAQRGFQANARTVTATDTIIKELLNTVR